MEDDSADPRGVPEAMDLVHGLRAIVVELDVMGARFADEHRMHTTDVRALIVLLDAARVGHTSTPSWLRSQLAITSATATALVDRLEDAGYVLRQPVPGDRRRVALEVTDHARKVGWQFFGPLIGAATTQLAAFTDDERATIRRYQLSMLAAIQASNDQ